MSGPLWKKLPNGWTATQIKRVGDVTLGKMLQSSNSGDDVLAPYLRAANVQPDGELALDDAKQMWFAPDELEALAVRAGDVVVVEGGQGGFGRAAYVSSDLGGWGLQNSINRIRPGDDSDGRFLAYYLIALRASGFIHAYCNVVSMPHLTAEKLATVPIAVPTLPLQSAIANYLDRETAQIDTLIAEQRRLLSMLRERRAALIRSSVPDSRSTAVPVDKLGRRTRIGNGSTPRRDEVAFWDGGHIPWLNSAVVNQERVTEAEQFVTDEAAARCHLPLVPAGSVLVALTGQGKTRGTATILDIEASINQHMAYVTPDLGFWDPDYLMWCLTAAYPELRAISDENGSTKGALTCGDLKNFRVARPPVDEQRRIVGLLRAQTAKLEDLIAETERFITLSRERRLALITAAVTGQIDVREAS